MPNIYLSPSSQFYNEYITVGNEGYWMNRVADALEPYLRASGISFTRNSPEMTAAYFIRESNAGNYDLHVALHTNASPDELAGRLRGIDAYHAPNSVSGYRAAQLFVRRFREIYPYPEKVNTRSTTYLGEVVKTRAPAVLLEIGYHDNAEDARWITSHIEQIARAVALGITDYFGVPFVEPSGTGIRRGSVTADFLNIRSQPNTGAPVLARAPYGSTLLVYGENAQGWLSVDYNGISGYASGAYVDIR